MSKIWFRSTRMQAFSLLGLEALFILIITLFLMIFKGGEESYSFALGGSVSILPNIYFTYQVFKENKPSAAKSIVKAFYWSEFIKLVLMAILFFIFMKLINLHLWSFILGFLIAQMGVWLAPILFLKDYGVKHQ